MFKAIKDFFFGKQETAVQAAVVQEAVVQEAVAIAQEVTAQLHSTHDAIVASGQPDDSAGLDAAIAAQAAVVPKKKPATKKRQYDKAPKAKAVKTAPAAPAEVKPAVPAKKVLARK